jgi:hypothetical protein
MVCFMGKKIFLLHFLVPRPYLEPTQPPTVVTRGLYLWLGHEADHAPLSAPEVNNKWSCTWSLQYAFIACTETTLFHVFSLHFLTRGKQANSEWKYVNVKAV